MAKSNMLEGESPEETLLLNLGHEILNFRPGFPRSKLKHTFILSNYGSGMFGLMPNHGKVYLGIPARFHEKFKDAKWMYAARVRNQPGLFLVMHIGKGDAGHPVGIRIFVRSKRLAALDSRVTTLRAVPMDKNGLTTRENDLLQGFNLNLLQKDDFEWERAINNEDDY